MTQNEKELLLKDLSCRLPYGVICEYGYGNDLELNGIDKPNTITFKCATKSFWITDDLDKCKPYLFPISSLTNEQRNDFPFESSLLNAFINGYISLFEDEELTVDDIIRMMDWFNKNHIDYRGLIPMGLAIDASNLNIY